MNLIKLTSVVLQLNAVIDSGDYDGISLEDVKDHIRQGDIVRWLQEHAPDADLSLLSDDDVREYGEMLAAIDGGYAGSERKKWGVEKKGLCLLLAWTNELIQQRKWSDAH